MRLTRFILLVVALILPPVGYANPSETNIVSYETGSDCQPAIQAMLESNGRVKLPPRRFYVANPVILRANQTLEGVYGKTLIYTDKDIPVIQIGDGAESAAHWKIRNLHLRGNNTGAAQAGLKLNGVSSEVYVSYGQVENVFIEKMGGKLISADHGWSNTFRKVFVGTGATPGQLLYIDNSSLVEFISCDFQYSSYAGYAVQVERSNSISFKHCQFFGNTSTNTVGLAADTHYVRNIVFDGCWFDNNAGRTIYLGGSSLSSIVLENSYIYRTRGPGVDYGVYLSRGRGSIIRGNKWTDSSWDNALIFVNQDARYTQIESNSLIGAQVAPLLIDHHDEAPVYINAFVGTGLYGGAIVTNTVREGSSGNGVEIDGTLIKDGAVQSVSTDNYARTSNKIYQGTVTNQAMSAPQNAFATLATVTMPGSVEGRISHMKILAVCGVSTSNISMSVDFDVFVSRDNANTPTLFTVSPPTEHDPSSEYGEITVRAVVTDGGSDSSSDTVAVQIRAATTPDGNNQNWFAWVEYVAAHDVLIK